MQHWIEIKILVANYLYNWHIQLATGQMLLITCTTAILPTIIFQSSRQEFILPKLAWVERREARHVSKFPLSPSNGGTRMSKEETSWKTGQSWNAKISNLLINLWFVSSSIKTGLFRWFIRCLLLWLIYWVLTYLPGESGRISEHLLLTKQRKILRRHVNIWKSVQIWSPQAHAGILACRAICAKYIQALNKENSNEKQRYTHFSILWTTIGFQRAILAIIKSKRNNSNLKKEQLPPRSAQYS